MSEVKSGFFKNKTILVTGGAGFIGSHLVERLVGLGAHVVVPVRTRKSSTKFLDQIRGEITIRIADLQERRSCIQITRGVDIVMHLAKVAKGLNYNKGRQGYIFEQNLVPFINILEASRINGVERFLTVSSACIYPSSCSIPTPEEEGFKDTPEPSNVGYGWAKRMQEFLSQTYAEEHGMKIAIARPYNAYGPRDDFSQEAHVIPSIIKRVLANEDPLVTWGDGSQSRSFLYVDDFVNGLLLMVEKYTSADPVNIGNNKETKIKDLIKMIVRLSGKHPKIIFDTNKPVGQKRRNCDTTKLKKVLGYRSRTSLELGLAKTINWYRKYTANKK